MAIQAKATLTQGSIHNHLIKLTLPMILGLIAIFLFNLADTFFISKLGTPQLAAMAFTFPISFIIMGITFGLGTGTSAIVGIYIGQKDQMNAQKSTLISLLLSIFIVTCIASVGLFTLAPLFSLLGATPSQITLITHYMSVWYIGLGFLVIPMVGNSALRAIGNTTTPSIILTFSALLNIILDPLLIFGYGPFPRLELKGAAIATVISWMAMTIPTLFVLYKKERLLYLKTLPFQEFILTSKKILHIGIPASATNLLTPLSITFLMAMITNHGEASVAAYGILSRIEPISLVGILALSTTLPAFISQNFGANLFDRVTQSLISCLHFSFLLEIGIGLLLFFTAPHIAGLFSKDILVIQRFTLFVRIMCVSYGLYSIVILSGAAFNAINKPYIATAYALFRITLFLALSFIGNILYGLEGLFIGASIGNALMGLSVYIHATRYFKTITLQHSIKNISLKGS